MLCILGSIESTPESSLALDFLLGLAKREQNIFKKKKRKVRFGYFSPALPISIIVGWQKSSARDHSFCQTTFSAQLSFPNWPPFLLIPPHVLVTTQSPRYCTISTEIVTSSLVNFPQITHFKYAICFLQVLWLLYSCFECLLHSGFFLCRELFLIFPEVFSVQAVQ